MEDGKGKTSSNPYVIDKSINWRDACREHRRADLEIRRAERTKPVHEQHTYITRTMGSNIPRIRQELSELCQMSASDGEVGGKESKKGNPFESPFDAMNEETRKQTSRELIELKREIFLLEFALHTKREVIANLQLKSLNAEKKMEDAEKRLIHDSQLFDEFLDEKNQAAFDAMATAEAEIKRHKQKLNQIKGLNAQICEVRADICRLEDIFAYKDDIKQFIFLVNMNQSNSDNRPISMSCDDWKTKWENTCDESVEIPFENPNALLEKIFELEDRNLSLIGHFQQSEEEFDEIKHLFKITANKLGSQIDQLKSHMDVIDSTVLRNDARAEELEFMCSMFAHGDAEFQDQDAELDVFEKEIQRVYNGTIGQHNLDMHVDSLTMLTFIETRLEDLIDMEENLPPTRVKEAQKERDKQRRIEAREQKIVDQDLAQQERSQKMKNRVAADVRKRIGRRLVQRSRPCNQQVKKTANLEDEEDDRDAEFFTY